MTPAPLPSLAALSTSPAAARARVAPAEPVQALQPVRALGSGAGSAFSDDPFARLLESRREAARLEERRQQDRTAEQPRNPATAPRSPSRADAAPAPADGSRRAAADSEAGDRQAAASRRPLPDNGSSGVQRRWLDTRAAPGRAAGAAAGSAAQPATPDAAAERLAAEGGPGAKATRANASDQAEPPPNGLPPGADPRAQKAGLMPVECPCPPAEALAGQGSSGAEAAAAGLTEAAPRPSATPARLATTDAAAGAALGTAAATQAGTEKAALAAAEAKAEGARAAASPSAPQAGADALGQAPAWGAATGPAGLEAQAPNGPGALPGAAATSTDPAAAPGSEASPLPAPAGAPGLATGETRTNAAAAPATAAQANLPAAPGHPAFPAQLASQLSIWVRAGVQQAQLHLNPAELGPVQVAIALEGGAAQVRLVAEHATTRQALEQALPALAGQLAEAGLMLSGGGVFDQSAHRDGTATPGHNALRGRAPGTADAAEQPAAGTMALQPRGLVDLLA